MVANPRQAALGLSAEILDNIELRDISLSAIMLKCARLSRLLGNERRRQLFSYEAGGYPSEIDGVSQPVFELGRISGRVYAEKDKDGRIVEKIKLASVETLEQLIESNQKALVSAADPDVSVASANPNQSVYAPMANSGERAKLSSTIQSASKILAHSRSFAYEYASSVNYELNFSQAASSIFGRISNKVDLNLLTIVPKAANKTASINENLRSDNPEDWANAVHSCRRMLQEVADALFPAQEPRESNGKLIKLGPDNYINRLIAFIEDNSGSQRFQEIVGSTITYIGERLDAVFKAAQKGSHSQISTREEAERYVVYTYMTVGDILALKG